MGESDNRTEQRVYHIKVEGRLDAEWNDWFPGFVITARPDGTTNLCGEIEDQSVLHGILARVRDLNIKLLSVEAAPGGPGAGECGVCRTLYGRSKTAKKGT